ncbi:MAG: hypothetical protein SOZ46_02340, partial [Bullifex sp.]|nr:hypothetical protein [Spirochaetales bacterium]MDY2816154.1 hypothetical protein [Bullifex sp.]MDY3849646.1 hypothetical protein [Bullifex sp.]
KVRSFTEHLMIPGMPELVNPYLERGLDNRAFGWRAIRDEGHTYVVDNGTRPGEAQKRILFDNVNDPYQLNAEELDGNDERAVYYDALLKGELEKSHDDFLLRR